jgi:hypothetical protein
MQLMRKYSIGPAEPKRFHAGFTHFPGDSGDSFRLFRQKKAKHLHEGLRRLKVSVF